ncbi:actin-histidine N-methyltransferase-like [Tubulanus polymorphus]|uniref:actin-histidine N-methyltransferase-like n=1 Tax=Tubulanus polymorphus TaxID=672921 RepID=UPI003DA2041D
MGKKHHPGRANRITANTKALSTHVQLLLEKCSNPLNNGSNDWNDHLEIRDIIEKIRKLQEGKALIQESREESLKEFLSWCENNFNTEAVSIAEFDLEGYGLKATRDIKSAELFLEIPRKMMITSDSAKASVLGQLISQDKILQIMPNVALALHLLCERNLKNSFWRNYINILPEEYTTPLYFSLEDLVLLKGSPTLSECLAQYRNIARQYAYFYQVFQNHPSAKDLPLRKQFCYDDYRWAVSTVMTRQNQIPSKDGSHLISALIPLWDMSNHCHGEITTDYSLEKDCSECYALQDFKLDEQIYIFYGARSNSELLIHSGFVYEDNLYDKLSIKLGISKNDALYKKKTELLMKCDVPQSKSFCLQNGPNPVGIDLLVFLRVFSMDEATLSSYLGDGTEIHDFLEKLKNPHSNLSKENEMKAWSYLETRAALLMKSYPSSVQEDEQNLSSPDLSPSGRSAIQLTLCERQILKKTINFAAQQKLILAEVIPGVEVCGGGD